MDASSASVPAPVVKSFASNIARSLPASAAQGSFDLRSSKGRSTLFGQNRSQDNVQENLAAYGGAAAFPVSYTQSSAEADHEHAILWGIEKPPRFRSMDNDSILYLIDSSQRISGTPLDFVAQCGMPISGLTVEITRVQLPKLPNVTQFNNTATIVSTVGTFSINIPIGFYNPISLVNAIKTAFDAAFVTLDTFTVLYNTTNKTISIASNNALPWYFVDTSPFIVRGANLTGFQGAPAGSDPTVVGDITNYSGILGMCYTRYVRIRSRILCRFARESSRASAQITNVVACVSLANYYNPTDYDLSGAFSGAIITDHSTDSSSICNLAAKTQLNEVDIRIEDEFGTSLQDVLYLGDPYPQPSFNAVLWLYVSV